MNAINANPPDRDDEPVDRHVRLLRELAEMTMALARAAARRALQQPEDEAASRPNPTLVFAKLSREIRETIKLEAGIAAGRLPTQLAASVRARRPGSPAGGSPAGGSLGCGSLDGGSPAGGLGGDPGENAGGDTEEGRRATLLRLLTEAIEADDTIADPKGFVPDIAEALDEPEVAAAIRGGAPLRKVVERVCDELGIAFDYAVLTDRETAAAEPCASGREPGAPRGSRRS